MPRSDVLDHILDATKARPCGRDRHKGHCLAHGSQKNPDLSIQATDTRILLHCFAGCDFHEICTSLGVAPTDLFFDAPRPRGSRPIPKPVRPDRIAVAFRFDVSALDLRMRAAKILQASKSLDLSTLSDSELDRALGHVGQAYGDQERAELFKGVADGLRVKDLNERQPREQHRRAG